MTCGKPSPGGRSHFTRSHGKHEGLNEWGGLYPFDRIDGGDVPQVGELGLNKKVATPFGNNFKTRNLLPVDRAPRKPRPEPELRRESDLDAQAEPDRARAFEG